MSKFHIMEAEDYDIILDMEDDIEDLEDKTSLLADNITVLYGVIDKLTARLKILEGCEGIKDD